MTGHGIRRLRPAARPAGRRRARRRPRPRPARAAGRARSVAALAPAGDRGGSPSGFPSTTATSMGTFGTGLAAGVARPARATRCSCRASDRLLNELSWEDGPDPRAWQPHETVFERGRRGRRRRRPGRARPSSTGPASPTPRCAGAASSPRSRSTRGSMPPLRAVRASPRSLVHLYWGELDKVGHVHGCDSWQWGDELEAVDRELARLAAVLPDDCSLTVTADHGMVDVPHEPRARRRATSRCSPQAFGTSPGRPARPQLYVEPGAARRRPRGVDRACWATGRWCCTREQAVAAGWFGRGAAARTSPRIGDVVVATRGRNAVVDSRRARPELLALRRAARVAERRRGRRSRGPRPPPRSPRVSPRG